MPFVLQHARWGESGLARLWLLLTRYALNNALSSSFEMFLLRSASKAALTTSCGVPVIDKSKHEASDRLERVVGNCSTHTDVTQMHHSNQQFAGQIIMHLQ